MIRVLVTGFGPFPGAPYNPTPTLVSRLVRLRRPALADIVLIPHMFRVSYAAVDHDLPQLLSEHRPDALLMFGLAARTPFVRIETRARNAVTQIWPDAAQTRIGKRAIAGSEDALGFGPHTSRLLRAAQATGIDARLSRDAGAYLCNYLCWRALQRCAGKDGAPVLAAFIHVPLIGRDGGPWRGIASRIDMDQLTDAGEAMLLELVQLARKRKLERVNPAAR
jgi:pyroglutamyl-peptidase